ncbi:hypothetical protein RBI27_16645 [Acinetobacter baumannii]|uniref:hypothetical protein n=1 Tax=Acinetobacter baumannii TaxID=470 RepID=UPI001DDD77AA|nr:hypothetical protein [Acinetobacter baumannii]EHU2507933.1 hypothetical protein [Acinetobacter baumannii]MDQ2342943.1 hypothetical protein [Acinetobacter baumannii]MDQ2592520.1 hypothetical protein [Acinetobacter baumannii]
MDKPITFNEWLGTQGNMVLLHANCCRIAYEAGQQSQQAKVEELQKQLSEYIFVAETLDEMYVKEVQKSDELQKRLDKALELMQKPVIVGEPAKYVCARFKEIEQALKGEGQ